VSARACRRLCDDATQRKMSAPAMVMHALAPFCCSLFHTFVARAEEEARLDREGIGADAVRERSDVHAVRACVRACVCVCTCTCSHTRLATAASVAVNNPTCYSTD
jgi:hypothetical protein